MAKKDLLTRIDDSVPGPDIEHNAVENFKKTSSELKAMRRLVLENSVSGQYKQWLQEIEKAVTFSAIMEATERFDLNQSSTAKILGEYVANALFFFAGFTNKDANFTYYAHHLRENANGCMIRFASAYLAPRFN